MAEERTGHRRRLLVAIVALVVGGAALGAYAILVLTAPPGNRAPVAAFTAVRELMVVDVNASASADPDGTVVDFHWTWGDGGSESTGPNATAAHTYGAPGRYAIVLRVTDDDGAVSDTTREVSVNTSTLDWVFTDAFNVPLGEWWDYRAAIYGDRPIGAECFSATSIATGTCQVSLAGVPDVATYPYTVWARFGLGGGEHWVIAAPYRLRVTGVNVPGYTLDDPVFLPTLNASEPVGARLAFDWQMRFLDTATANELDGRGCGITANALDGFHVRSLVTITMDLPQSRRMFNVSAADPAAAQAWWDANVDPACNGRGLVEQGLWDWLQAMGGGPSPASAGKYDIMNGYEWFLDQAYLDLRGAVAPDGTTTVTIDHTAWGTGNTLSRMFYWGASSYLDGYLDSSTAAGWSGMEPYGWFEEFAFSGSVEPAGFDFQLDAAVQYGLRQIALRGPNGVLDRVDDVPVWTWGPHLQDYLDDFLQHPRSELDRYPGATDPVVTTGAPEYGQPLPRDFVPIGWDLDLGETWHFEFPPGPVAFHDPNLTPLGADPGAGEFVTVSAPLRLSRTMPNAYGRWNPDALTWDVVGPSATGGPAGSPGPDGLPGTSDDDYPAEPWGAIYLGAGPSPGSSGAPEDAAPFFQGTLAVGALVASTVPSTCPVRASFNAPREPSGRRAPSVR
jgi:PKD repeat protein